MQKVWKKSRKPFKSGKKVNTVKEITKNPHTGKPAYSFVEDDSVVSIEMCEDTPQEYVDLLERLENKREERKTITGTW